jgi:mono/diheme cytochrome c family protein
MGKQTIGVVLVIGLFTLLLSRPAAAGGWTVVTLDELPVAVRAGEPVQIGFQVQQHGLHPLTLGAEEVILTARKQGSNETFRAVARPTGKPGHYGTEIVFPASGVWRWEIKPGAFPPASMPALTVAAGAAQTGPDQAAYREWNPWQQVLFQMMALLRTGAEDAPTPAAEHEPATDLVTYGQALFVAKGCATCHVHVEALVPLTTQVGPDLTDYRVIPEYVTVWLRDPKSIKPQTQMPTLPLQEGEIEALVAFLSAE